MAILSAIVRGCPESSAEFFKKLKELVALERVKSVVSLQTGVEIAFLDEEALKKFVMGAPGNWAIKSSLSRDILVTVTPQLGQGHHQVTDQALGAALANWGTVKSGRKLTYKEFPSIENGVRQFFIEPKVGVVIPSSIRFGPAAFKITYKGMIRTCHRCRSTEHEVASCPEKWCHKCHQIGHLKSGCTNTALCVVCGSTDHSFASCPESYRNKLALKTTWSRPPRSPTQTPDQEKKTPKAPSNTKVQKSAEANTSDKKPDADKAVEPPKVPSREPTATLTQKPLAQKPEETLHRRSSSRQNRKKRRKEGSPPPSGLPTPTSAPQTSPDTSYETTNRFSILTDSELPPNEPKDGEMEPNQLT